MARVRGKPPPFTIKSVAKIWVRNWDCFLTVPLQEFFLLSWQNTGIRRESSLLKCNRRKIRTEKESENTEIFPFIFNMQTFLCSCFISHNIIIGSPAVAVHAHIASKMGSPPFSSYRFLQQRKIFSLSSTNNTLEKEPLIKDSLSVNGDNTQKHTNVTCISNYVLHALLHPLEPPCGCSPNYSPPVSFPATALLHSCLWKIRLRKSKRSLEIFVKLHSSERNPGAPPERKEMEK